MEMKTIHPWEIRKKTYGHTGGPVGNPKNLTHKFPEDLHEGHVKSGKLVLKGQ